MGIYLHEPRSDPEIIHSPCCCNESRPNGLLFFLIAFYLMKNIRSE